MPRKTRTSLAEESNCVACNRPDDVDNFVQCDACDSWWHFSCAKVTESISDRSWTCVKCTDDGSISFKSGVSGRSGSQLVENMARLKERQEMEKKRMELDLQKKFLDEQQRLLDATMEAESSKSRLSRHESVRRVEEWVRCSEEPEEGAVGGTKLPAASRTQQLQSVPKHYRGTTDTLKRQPQHDQRDRCSQQQKRAEILLQELESQLNECKKQFADLQLSLGRKDNVVERLLPLRSVAKTRTVNTEQDCNPRVYVADNCEQQRSEYAHSNFRTKQQDGERVRFDVDYGCNEQQRNECARFDCDANELQYNERAFGDCSTSTDMQQRDDRSRFDCSTTNQRHDERVNFGCNFDTSEQQRSLDLGFESSAKDQQRKCRSRPRFSLNQGQPDERVRFEFDLGTNEQRHNERAHFNSGANEQKREPYVIQDERGPYIQSIGQESRNPMIQGPTHQQLAARQSLARDLPTFSGDPSEWPIFISNFTYTTAACGYTDVENMVRLQRCLKGQALEMVRNRLVLPAAVPNVIETLRLRYGRPEVLINTLLQKVRSIPIPKSDKLEGLVDYGMAVQGLCEHIEAANELAHLSNPTLLQELVNKLPADQKMMWAGYKRDFPAGSVNLRTFGNYMAGIVRDASSVLLFEPENVKVISKEKMKPKEYVNSHTSETSEEVILSKCFYCDDVDHYLRDCEMFQNIDVDERWWKVRELRLCQNCLFGHGGAACRNRSRCNTDGCQFRHHPLLHTARKADTPPPIVAENHAHRFLDSNLLFRVIPVTLYGKSGSIEVFAFIDEGSSVTLVESELIAQLEVTGSPQPLCLHWTGSTSRNEKNSQKISLDISGAGKNKRYTISNARTVDRLNLPSQNFNLEEAVKRYKHLKNIPVQGYQDVSPKILIGIDNLRLTLPLEVKEGDGSGPVAVKTRLGWCVYGRQRDSSNDDLYSFHVSMNMASSDPQHFSMKELTVAQSNAALQRLEYREKHVEQKSEIIENLHSQTQTKLKEKEDSMSKKGIEVVGTTEIHTTTHFMHGNSVKEVPTIAIDDQSGFQRESVGFTDVPDMRDGYQVLIAEYRYLGWPRGRVDRVIQARTQHKDGELVNRYGIEWHATANSTQIPGLDVDNNSSAALGVTKMHPGENVAAAAISATLPSKDGLSK